MKKLLIISTWLAGMAPGPITGVGEAAPPEEMVIYSTQFEPSEGYDDTQTLAGQNGWESFGTGGNGLTDIWEGFGHQAFVGFTPFDELGEPDRFSIFVFQPLNHEPDLEARPLVLFRVRIQISDSENGHYDDFRWSIFNTELKRLFTLDFDNDALAINYALDDDLPFVATGVTFGNDSIYDLEIRMDFGRNQWSAKINDLPIVTGKPITTKPESVSLTLGDIDAIWAVRDVENPGDNFMLFDNYRVIAAPRTELAPFMEFVGFTGENAVVRLTGEAETSYRIQGSSNLENWDDLSTRTTDAEGKLEYVDEAAVSQGRRYYRAYLAP